MEATSLTSALLDIQRITNTLQVPWALVGGQALIAYGVPRETLDADALLPPARLVEVAEGLVTIFGWVPLVHDSESGDYVETDSVTVHEMDDPVLFDVHQQRQMIPLSAPLGQLVELLAAQHPIEDDMIDFAAPFQHSGVVVPVAPLGGVLLVKAKADRSKDNAAIEQAAEHLSASAINGALQWATERDPATSDDLRAIIVAARARRVPVRTVKHPRKP